MCVCLGWEGVGHTWKEDLEANVLAPVSEILTQGLGMGRARVSHPWEALLVAPNIVHI